MKIYKKIMIFILFILVNLSVSIPSLSEDNAGSGDGDTAGAVKDKGFYRSGEWMYKASIYVGLKDSAETNSSFYFNYKAVEELVFIKTSNFNLTGDVIFGKHNKVNYLRGAQLESLSNPKIITDNPPPIPITHGGNLQSVKKLLWRYRDFN